jgi:hypothetical protein
MRALIGALGTLALLGAAHADDLYVMPPLGTQLTYRLISTARIADKSLSFTTGQVYTYTVTAVNGPALEAAIRPVAVIFGCSASNTTKDCIWAAKVAGSSRDGDLVTIPLPAEIADGLTKGGILRTRYFLTEERVFPVAGPKNPDDPSDAVFGSAPLFVLTNKLVCDYNQLKDFLPLGKSDHVTLACHNIFSKTQSRAGPDQNSDQAVSAEFSYDGSGRVSLPSGDWDVQKVAVKFVPSESGKPTARVDYDIAIKLGVAVRVRSTVDAPAAHVTSESTGELIALKP